MIKWLVDHLLPDWTAGQWLACTCVLLGVLVFLRLIELTLEAI